MLALREVALQGANWNTVAAFKAPFLLDRMGSKENEVQNLEQMFSELKKFLFICSVSDKPVAMLDDRVDQMWHEFLVFTKEYRDFCQSYLGKFIDHRPNVSTSPTTLGSKWVFEKMYTEYFGEPPNGYWASAYAKVLDGDPNQRLDCQSCASGECGGNYLAN
jgi:hypothetical protein